MNEEDFRRHFGVVLKQARSNSGLTQQALEEATGIQRGYISDLERGRKSISLFKIFVLCKALSHTSLSDFSKELEKRVNEYENV